MRETVRDKERLEHILNALNRTQASLTRWGKDMFLQDKTFFFGLVKDTNNRTIYPGIKIIKLSRSYGFRRSSYNSTHSASVCLLVHSLDGAARGVVEILE